MASAFHYSVPRASYQRQNGRCEAVALASSNPAGYSDAPAALRVAVGIDAVDEEGLGPALEGRALSAVEHNLE